MGECGDHAMLVADPFDGHVVMFQNLPAVRVDQPSYLRARQQHRFLLLA